MPMLQTRGYPLYYRLVGKPTGKTPIILIHGLVSNHKDWLLQLPVLCRDRQVLLLDLPGHGRSGYNTRFSVQAMAEDIYTLTQELKISRWDVAGISMGGMVAMALAAIRPGLVNRLMLINTAPSLNDLELSVRCMVPLRRLIAMMPMTPLARILLWYLLPHRNQTAFRHHALPYWEKSDPKILLKILNSLTRVNLWNHLHGIQAKTLFIRGDNDSFTKHAAARVCQLIPDARLVTVADSGHATIVDRSAHFNELMTGFLDAHCKTPGILQPH